MCLHVGWRGQMLTLLSRLTPFVQMISVIHNEASLLAASTLTQVNATDVAQSSNVPIDALHRDVGSHRGNNAPARDPGQVLPVSNAKSQHMTIGVVMNVAKKTLKKPLTAEKREEINARR